jgi:hypothetical protein
MGQLIDFFDSRQKDLFSVVQDLFSQHDDDELNGQLHHATCIVAL